MILKRRIDYDNNHPGTVLLRIKEYTDQYDILVNKDTRDKTVMFLGECYNLSNLDSMDFRSEYKSGRTYQYFGPFDKVYEMDAEYFRQQKLRYKKIIESCHIKICTDGMMIDTTNIPKNEVWDKCNKIWAIYKRSLRALKMSIIEDIKKELTELNKQNGV